MKEGCADLIINLYMTTEHYILKVYQNGLGKKEQNGNEKNVLVTKQNKEKKMQNFSMLEFC